MTDMKTLSGEPASSLSFGTMQFGSNADEIASAEMFEACREAGVNSFDTAYVYNSGRSEEIYGALARNSAEELLTATKVAQDLPSTAEVIRKSLDVSRQRLGMDQVDILYLHRYDDETPLEESIEALVALQSEGLIRYIGVSNFAAWQTVNANNIAKALGSRIDVAQPMYNLVKRQAEVEILPACFDQDIAVFNYSPLGGGLLTGKYARGETGRLDDVDMYAKRYAPNWMRDAARRLLAISDKLDVASATLAVAWSGYHPAVTSPIISARSAEQLQPSLDALSFDMSADLYDEISALTPRPSPATDRLEEL